MTRLEVVRLGTITPIVSESNLPWTALAIVIKRNVVLGTTRELNINDTRGGRTWRWLWTWGRAVEENAKYRICKEAFENLNLYSKRKMKYVHTLVVG